MKTLIHIGAPKTATTFLQETYYPLHPELAYIPQMKEWSRWMWSLDKTKIKALAISDEGVMGHIKKRRTLLMNLERLVKDPLVLITTRAPDHSLLFSIYSQIIRIGGRESFEDYFTKKTAHWADVFNYQSVYDECCSIYGSENVMLLPQELLRADPSQFYRMLEERLAISQFDPPKNKQVNQRLTWDQIEFYRTFWPSLSRIASLHSNREMPLYIKKMHMSHTPIMNAISEKIGRLCNRTAKQSDLETSKFLESFNCYVSAMEMLPCYEDLLERYKKSSSESH
ncbi:MULTISPECIES: hypothetical protein [unclassified Lentimonas]|uniref:hypothetical protein n=1 Tax=unclassified Lentimonas TaxID=2630993 RepID=UPI001323CBFE|nr:MULTISPECIES: hypothetical protein [unclassified Lentimonas]CAA6690207.1 Unannotated [Lentimonas sp. CC10]CAA6695968.1 Unannotated [Lentimonas sp. CC19]CAA7070235.1 Unannotated [Lentimonas sp. CC11]